MAMISQAAYHLDELVPMGRALSELGFAPTLYLTEGRPGPLQQLRSQHRRYRRSVRRLAHFGMRLAGERTETIGDVTAMIAMTDWVVTAPLLDAAAAQGALTVAKVEGAQDFEDHNAARDRRPYRRAQLILCQGPNDFEALADTTRHIVGNSRLEGLLSGPPRTDPRGPIVINSNFSYGILTEHRKAWVHAAITACESAGRRFVISQHPADRSLVGVRHRSRRPVEELLDSSSGLITRFSSLGFGALARGVPLHYFNVHGENMGPFAESAGAFDVTSTKDALTSQLQAPVPDASEVRERAAAFLERQVDVTETPAAMRAARVIADALG